jgi:hypothetical protein
MRNDNCNLSLTSLFLGTKNGATAAAQTQCTNSLELKTSTCLCRVLVSQGAYGAMVLLIAANCNLKQFLNVQEPLELNLRWGPYMLHASSSRVALFIM